MVLSEPIVEDLFHLFVSKLLASLFVGCTTDVTPALVLVKQPSHLFWKMVYSYFKDRSKSAHVFTAQNSGLNG